MAKLSWVAPLTLWLWNQTHIIFNQTFRKIPRQKCLESTRHLIWQLPHSTMTLSTSVINLPTSKNHHHNVPEAVTHVQAKIMHKTFLTLDFTPNLCSFQLHPALHPQWTQHDLGIGPADAYRSPQGHTRERQYKGVYSFRVLIISLHSAKYWGLIHQMIAIW